MRPATERSVRGLPHLWPDSCATCAGSSRRWCGSGKRDQRSIRAFAGGARGKVAITVIDSDCTKSAFERFHRRGSDNAVDSRRRAAADENAERSVTCRPYAIDLAGVIVADEKRALRPNGDAGRTPVARRAAVLKAVNKVRPLRRRVRPIDGVGRTVAVHRHEDDARGRGIAAVVVLMPRAVSGDEKPSAIPLWKCVGTRLMQRDRTLRRRWSSTPEARQAVRPSWNGDARYVGVTIFLARRASRNRRHRVGWKDRRETRTDGQRANRLVRRLQPIARRFGDSRQARLHFEYAWRVG